MNRIEVIIIHDKEGGWTVRNKIDYSDEELQIISEAAANSIELNKRYREAAKISKRNKKMKAEQRKQIRGIILDKLFGWLFPDSEEE